MLAVGGVDLDSLEAMHAAAALNEMFHLDEEHREGRRPVTVGEWLDAIVDAQSGPVPCVTVMTSGSTGRPKPCTHRVDDLHEEVAHYASVLPPVRRVIALVPAHHIYGLIWTALLPAALGVPVVDATTITMPEIRAGDLIVAVPDQWRALSRSRRPCPPGVTGASAGAPLENGLADDVLAWGVGRLYDVYGSSETAGVATREASQAWYSLLPRWRFAAAANEAAPVLVDRRGHEMPLPDRIALGADGRFLLAGRHDGAVQVGGVNVWPDRVAEVLRTCPGVGDVAVRLGSEGRLKAFVVPSASGDGLREQLHRHASRLLRSEQRPTSYAFGDRLPQNALGKKSDWL
ncbi:MAG: AMP-binding protein [Janthinobacterium lividum]